MVYEECGQLDRIDVYRVCMVSHLKHTVPQMNDALVAFHRVAHGSDSCVIVKTTGLGHPSYKWAYKFTPDTIELQLPQIKFSAQTDHRYSPKCVHKMRSELS